MGLHCTARRVAVALLLGISTQLIAAPFTPASDSEVVERLPLATDPSARRVESLRRQLAAKPADNALRIEVARQYFELAMAQGDPRLVGYAAATIAPMAPTAADNSDYWFIQGLIQQYSHNFEGSLQSLAKAAQLNPAATGPLSWRSAVLMVQARYPEALAECERLAPLAEPLLVLGCRTFVKATTGELRASFEAMQQALKDTRNASPELLLWLYTRLGEMAMRLPQPDVAEDFFTKALKLGLTDQYLLGAHADLLMARQRPAEVIQLLERWERSDVLLLRLALAGKAIQHPKARDWAAQLRDRFAAAALRGDRLHEQEAARFALDVEGNPSQALLLATNNYQIQKEPRDAEILMRAALAADKAAAAAPALEWLQTSRYEDPAMAALAAQLRSKGAKP
ncbi:hypothetical protein [Polaromonas sp. YR568]|uniref:hypothetical protein n=1 Tax=Polaromonas sp. YR568 TaxID=1855301 RepID=UPI00313832A9